jgi:hypothetical protein
MAGWGGGVPDKLELGKRKEKMEKDKTGNEPNPLPLLIFQCLFSSSGWGSHFTNQADTH